jgi:hypothetical protein
VLQGFYNFPQILVSNSIPDYIPMRTPNISSLFNQATFFNNENSNLQNVTNYLISLNMLLSQRSDIKCDGEFIVRQFQLLETIVTRESRNKSSFSSVHEESLDELKFPKSVL